MHLPLFSTFRFTSLVRMLTPSSPSNSLVTSSVTPSSTTSRAATKRSYLVFAWLRYLTTGSTHLTSRWKAQIVMLPSRYSLYTVTKAPMAHKTNSKEQFLFKFYHFSLTFKVLNRPRVAVETESTYSLAHNFYLTKKLFPVFETNLLYLKYYRIRYPLRDSRFFTY